MEDRTREHMVDGSIWLRGLHMLVFAVAYNVVEVMMALTAIFQFICALITGRVNEPLLQFAKNGALYIQEVMEFLTFNSEIKPFPFTPWPDEAHTGEAWVDGEVDGEIDEERDAAFDDQYAENSEVADKVAVDEVPVAPAVMDEDGDKKAP